MKTKTLKSIKKGLIIVISAPSGAGKTTLCKEALKKLKNTIVSVSVTTRKPRPLEKNGKDYFFVSEQKFKSMISKKEFAEWALVHGHYYGTPKKRLIDTINKGKNIMLIIDVQGGEKIRRIFKDGLFIFVAPPSKKALEQRLVNRAQDNEETIKLRLKNAQKEMAYAKNYNHVVVNDKLNNAVAQIIAIIKSRKSKN
ncbi:MAG: guanylate kinase [Elusimicrobia bacterium]|nr:guanylate kinase [Elusimicrobiota bacterium]MBU2614621.1 guanylate kinase [Elusimicrobiota bacterium]